MMIKSYTHSPGVSPATDVQLCFKTKSGVKLRLFLLFLATYSTSKVE